MTMAATKKTENTMVGVSEERRKGVKKKTRDRPDPPPMCEAVSHKRPQRSASYQAFTKMHGGRMEESYETGTRPADISWSDRTKLSSFFFYNAKSLNLGKRSQYFKSPAHIQRTEIKTS